VKDQNLPSFDEFVRSLDGPILTDLFALRNNRKPARAELPLLRDMPDPNNPLATVEDAHLLGQIRKVLLARRFEEPQVLAFIADAALGANSDEIAALLRGTCRCRVRPSAIRQWRRRHFPKMRAALCGVPGLFTYAPIRRNNPNEPEEDQS
jgi:hypothetical protein